MRTLLTLGVCTAYPVADVGAVDDGNECRVREDVRAKVRRVRQGAGVWKVRERRGVGGGEGGEGAGAGVGGKEAEVVLVLEAED